MNTISVTYRLKWRFKQHHNIQVSECGKIFNTKTNRELKIKVNGYSIGFWLGKKFILKSKLNNYIELIPKIKTPF
jgi:hypothetical protein